MANFELAKQNFEQVVSENGMVLVDFWASWSSPCRTFEPIFEAASEQNPEIIFGNVDTEAQPELAGSFGTQSIPTLMILREQVGVYSQPGAVPSDALEELIARAVELDMEEVHRQVAADHAEVSAS